MACTCWRCTRAEQRTRERSSTSRPPRRWPDTACRSSPRTGRARSTHRTGHPPEAPYIPRPRIRLEGRVCPRRKHHQPLARRCSDHERTSTRTGRPAPRCRRLRRGERCARSGPRRISTHRGRGARECTPHPLRREQYRRRTRSRVPRCIRRHRSKLRPLPAASRTSPCLPGRRGNRTATNNRSESRRGRPPGRARRRRDCRNAEASGNRATRRMLHLQPVAPRTVQDSCRPRHSRQTPGVRPRTPPRRDNLPRPERCRRACSRTQREPPRMTSTRSTPAARAQGRATAPKRNRFGRRVGRGRWNPLRCSRRFSGHRLRRGDTPQRGDHRTKHGGSRRAPPKPRTPLR